jgi:hypothetical protein
MLCSFISAPRTRPNWLVFIIGCVISAAPLQSQILLTNCTFADLGAAVAQGGEVHFGCDGVITLASTIIVSSSLVLDGNGRNVTLSGGATNRLFLVEAEGRLILRGLSLINGRVDGVDGLEAEDGENALGGGIFNAGALEVVDCSFSDHTVMGGQGGAGVEVVISGVGRTRGGNGGLALGGAIYNTGVLEVERCSFSGNSASGGAGGAGAVGRQTGHGGDGGEGGQGGRAAGAAIYNSFSAIARVSESSFSSNRVESAAGGLGGLGGGILGFPGQHGPAGSADGAGIFNQGAMSVTASTFDHNEALAAIGLTGQPGVSGREGFDGTPGGSARGGGIFNDSNLTLVNSTLFSNSLTSGQGGDGGDGWPLGFGGDGGAGGPGGSALGGGLFNSGHGSATVAHCTFSANVLEAGEGGLGGVGRGFTGRPGSFGSSGTASGTALFNGAGVLLVQNSILNGFENEIENGPNAGGTIQDGGWNLSSDHTPPFTAAGSRNLTDPLLLAPALNGGATLTLALSPGSPAVNAIPLNQPCQPVDQRGVARVYPCDVGAFELGASLSDLAIEVFVDLNASEPALVLSWPESNDSIVLETTSSLIAPVQWTPLALQPDIENNRHTIRVAATNQAAFFRVRRP